MIEDKIQEFKTELKLKKDLDVVRKFITSGDSFVLDSDKYLDLKDFENLREWEADMC